MNYIIFIRSLCFSDLSRSLNILRERETNEHGHRSVFIVSQIQIYFSLFVGGFMIFQLNFLLSVTSVKS